MPTEMTSVDDSVVRGRRFKVKGSSLRGSSLGFDVQELKRT